MAFNACIISLYTRLKQLGILDGVHAVAELGSQWVYWPSDFVVLGNLCEAFGFQRPEVANDPRFDDCGSCGTLARHVYESLGLTYRCFDIDPTDGAIVLDINFDDAPKEHVGQYDLVTNFGTIEHVFNQLNAFRVMHDLTRPGGLMIHFTPVGLGYWNHGLFTHQPNLFVALAKYNSYDLLGGGINPDWQSMDIKDSGPEAMAAMEYGPSVTQNLLVLLRKTRDIAFRVPLQDCYEEVASPEKRAKYIA